MTPRSSYPFALLSWVILLACGLILGAALLPRAVSALQPDPIAAAWEKARAAGSYHFESNVTQMTIPVAKVTNVGRTGRTEQLRLEGESNLRENRLEMQLWSQGGSVLQGEGSVAIKVEDGKSYVRQGGGAWQASEGVLDGLAPQGDFLAYLQAMRDVQAHPPETRAGITFTRYSFTLDGPTFAAYVRDRMVEALRAKGELPPGVQLDASDYYRAMTGDGELWVGQDGLPLRQVLNLDFPEQHEQTVHAQLVVDFSQFGTPEQNLLALARVGDVAGLVAALPGRVPDLTPLLLLASLLACALLLVWYRRTRTVQAALATAVITSLVIGPLLSTLKLDAFFVTQTAKAAQQEEQQAAAETQRELGDALGRPEFNPQVNPLERTEYGIEDTGFGIAGLQSPQLLNLPSPTLQTTDPGTDTDADGLSDFAEVRVGTDGTLADSDEDGIKDGVEIKGFALGGQQWYADAQSLDSNEDGLGDGQEWDINGNSQPDDTDGDAIPDLFDADNDNDGVPDRQDMAPFSASAAATPFTENHPFQLTINNLTAGKPTFVDFQIRPTDPNHLWYAFNVLDWPRNDNAGQVQDIDNQTYADLAASQGRTAGTSEAYGDMKLVPMLEIRISGAVTNLPPQSALTPYNIAVRNLTNDASQKAVYLPLSIVGDEQTGARVAFTARMNYLPAGSWPSPHAIRLAWVVQMLTDLPCDHTDPQDVAAGCASDDYIHNVPQVLQTYYDDFTLTGLNVSEQHGAKTALIYEDPTVDPNLKDDVSLTALTLGLDHSFLAARDADNNGQRDVDINEIARRFDHTTNGSIAADQRWGLENAYNILRVERHDYPTFDQAAIHTTMTDTLAILTNRFNTAWAANNTIKPTIAYGYEQQSRSLGLDASKTSGGYVAISGTGVTVNLQPAGQPKASLNTMVGLKWTHYCRANNGVAWNACASDDYWTELEARYGAYPLNDEPNTPDIVAGSNAAMQLYNLTLNQGVSRVVQVDNQLLSGQYTLKTDAETAVDVRNGLNFGTAALKKIANLIVMDRYLNNAVVKAQLGTSVVNFLENGRARQAVKLLKANPAKGTALALGAGAAVGLLIVDTYYLSKLAQNSSEALATRILLRTLVVGLQTYAALIDPLLTLSRWSREVGSVNNELRSSSDVIGVSRTANAIGAVIAISVVWGFFIYSMVANKVSAFGPEFNRALAETIAATIYILILTVLAATVVGLIIVGVVAVIDAILTAVCELGVDDLRTVPGLGGACFTLGTAATKAIAYFLYNYDVMIDTSKQDMVAPGAPKTQLANPNKGFVVGNDFTVTMPITTHVVHKNPDPSSGIYINLYLYYFSRDNLRSTTFNYTLTQPNPQNVGASRGTMTGAWFNVAEDHKYVRTPMYGGYARSAPTISGFNLPAGVNRPANFYLNMGYALPAYECWAIPVLFTYPIPVCYVRTFTGKSSNKIETLRYDIFPNTVGGFMALGAKSVPGSSAGTGLSWDPLLPALHDADGDGLISAAFGGLDPNDAAWNSDNDNLPDTFELERRAAGMPYSLNHCDTDSDGLTDGQEAQIGSNPAIRDSDNDGLEDDEEVWHQLYDPSSCQPTNNWSGGWNVTINAATPFTIRVTSDPTQPDADADGISDLAEKQLVQNADPAKRVDKQNQPWHPNVFNVSPITVLTDVDDADRFVTLNQNLRYTTTVIGDVPLAPSMLDITAPGELGGSRLPALLTFDGANTAINGTEFTVQSGSNGQPLQITSNVRARLTPTGPSTRVWDPIAFQTFAPAPTHPNRFMAASPYLPGKQDSFLFSRMSSNSTGRGGLGDLRTNAIPTGQANTLFTANATTGPTMGNNAPDTACNNIGTCMVVWDQVGIANFTTTTDRAYYGVIRPDGSVQCCGNLGSHPDSFHPAVATDGTNFMVAYALSQSSGGTSITSIITQGFDSNGNRISTNYGYWDIGGVRINSSQISLDFVYSNGYYVVAWKWNDVDFANDRQIRSGLFDAGGDFTNGNNIETDAAHETVAGAPVLTTNPTNGNILLLYQGRNGEVRRSVMYSYVPNPTYAVLDGPLGNDPVTGTPITGNKLGATFDPRNSEWLITVDGRLMVYDQYMWYQPMPNQELALGNTVPLACPAVRSLSVADLRFEESPGATGFGSAACAGNGCPAAGLPGATDSAGNAVGTPASDYAVQFDGSDDELRLGNPLGSEFSLAFWYKASSGGGTAFFIESGQPNGMGFFHYNNSGVTEFFAGGTRIAANTNLSNGQWHFVALTRASNGALAMYLDGNPTPVVTSPTSPTPTMTGEIRMGGGSTRVGLDNLLLYNVALSGSSVQDLYNRTTQSFCVAAQGNRWTKINTTTPDTRGGKLTASGSLAVTIDSDLPTATISGLTHNQYLLGNTVHTIGGNASDPTSGVARVEISINDGPWQATSGAESWAYNLNVTQSGYGLRVRAIDAVGNIGNPSPSIYVIGDTTPPTVSINGLPNAARLPTRSANGQWQTTLNGDASGLFADELTAAVEVQLQGQGAAQGNGWQRATLSANTHTWSIDYLFASGLPDPTGTYTVSVRASDLVGNQSADNAATGILRLDATGPAAALSAADATRTVISNTLTINGVLTDTGTAGADKLDVAFLTVEQIAALPTDISAEQADAQLNRTWLPATVAQRGAGTSGWQLQVPTGLEGEYQIDLRATDTLGNVLRSDNVWRGVIDTLAPRVVVTGTRGAASWFDPTSGQQMYDLTFTCAATDRYLNELTFSCPAGGAPVRRFDTNPALQALFPDRTIVNGLTVSAAYWWPDPNVSITVSACDTYGHCTSSSQPLPPAGGQVAVNREQLAVNSAAVSAAATPGAPFALAVAPTAGSFVAADGDLPVSIVAEAGAALKEVTIRLDNTVVQTLTFAQSENVTRTLRTVNLAGVGEGQHTLVARATDWAGATQSTEYPVRFTLDRQAPAVTIDPATLTNADTWTPGSDVLRFNGMASDSIGLAAVQIREGNGDFVDVGFGNGTWQTALPVSDPEGRTLTIVVRAIDRAGRISEVTQNIGTNLSTPTAPDTTITARPANPSEVNTASFVFSGTVDVAVAFECQLDADAYTPCVSPLTLSDLSKGNHTFRVRAMDASGNVDLTPATATWEVRPSQLTTSITVSPATPSSSQDARFEFSGTGSSLECRLDGADFTACTSPQTYTALGYGDHTFDVRTRNGAGQIGVATRHSWTIINTPPVAANQSITTIEDTAVTVELTASDPDLLSYQVINPPTQGVLVGAAPTLSYLPNTGYSGVDSFTFRANDGRGESNVATISINVKPGNRPPDTTITAQPTNPSGQDVSFTFSGTDDVGVAKFECRLDGAAFAECTSPKRYTGLAVTTHTFEVRAVDTAGVADATPATYSWTVYTVVGICDTVTVYRNGQGQYLAPGWSGTINVGTSVANTLTGSPGADLILGLGGNDKLDGKEGNDLLCGGEGVDQLLGAAGNDYLDGGVGNDVLNSGTGDHDIMLGGEGNDTLLDGDGVSKAHGGAGTDGFTIALRGGWSYPPGQTSFNGLTAGYGNDIVGLANLGTTALKIDISGDERDTGPNPQDGTTDALTRAGRFTADSTIVKFERQTVTTASAEGELLNFEGFLVDPTTLTDESGAEFLTEPVGGEEGETGSSTYLFLPLITQQTQ